MEPEWIDKAERYLNGEMSAGERTEFESELSANAALRKDLELYNSINKAMSGTPNENELRDTLQQMNKKYFAGGAVVKKGSFKKWLAVAASLVLLVSIGFYFLLPSKPSVEKLYAEYAVHEPLSISQRENTDDLKADLLATEAEGFYYNKKYKEALPVLQQYFERRPNDLQAKFALGICNLELSRYPEAEKIFAAMTSGQTAYVETAKWYLVLTALKQKDMEKCKAQAKNITASSPYFTKAKALLEKLPD